MVTPVTFQLKREKSKMAALELHCGLETGGPRVWGGERVDLLDSFDSEMQEWEDQLQEMQKKIEDLYNEVKARREATETRANNGIINNKSLDITLLPVGSEYSQQVNGYHRGPDNIHRVQQYNEVGGPSVKRHNGFHYPSDFCNGSHLNPLHNSGHYPGSCHDIERQDATLDILNGYMQQGPQFGNSQKNLGAQNTNRMVHPVLHSYQESKKTSHGTNRTSSSVVLDAFEDAENKKNKKANMEESLNWKDPTPSQNLPLKTVAPKQRDAPPVPPRSSYHDSTQQPDRKCLLVDRMSGSPSVLRKFGAMLQENEGKTLIEDGLVTTVVPTEHLANTPVRQRKFSVGRASPRVTVQKKTPADCDVAMAELEPGQEPRAAVASRHVSVLNGDRTKGVSPPERSPLKTGCHKKVSESKEHKTGDDLFSDFRMVERILGAGSQHYGKVGVDTRWGNENLEQLLEMMEMENSRSQRAKFTQQLDTKQQVSCESSSAPRRSSFSRPTGPANQRRPTRWATPTSSKTRSTSCPPSVKGKQLLNSYSLHTETVIM